MQLNSFALMKLESKREQGFDSSSVIISREIRFET